MFTAELAEAICVTSLEVRQIPHARNAEAALAVEVESKELCHLPIVYDPNVPAGKLHIRYVDAVNRPHVVKELDIANELEAYNASLNTKRIGPQTRAEMLADFQERKRIENLIMAESLQQLEAGEITEDELYEGDMLIATNMYPLIFESKVRVQTLGAMVPISAATLEEFDEKQAEHVHAYARLLIQRAALKYLNSQSV